jgi:hypothetical protein
VEGELRNQLDNDFYLACILTICEVTSNNIVMYACNVCCCTANHFCRV